MREQPERIDPLYTIFEQHLYNFEDSDQDRKTFIANVLRDYLLHLRKLNIVIPKSLEGQVLEELAEQVNTMLVKKTYGCLTIQDFRKKTTPPERKRVKSRYSRLSVAAKDVKAPAPKRSSGRG